MYQNQEPLHTYVVPVVYAMPDMLDLKRRYDFVNAGYKGMTFAPIKACERISREPREVEFQYVVTDPDASTDRVLADMEAQDLRPALPEELLAFDAEFPGEKGIGPIAALGSELDEGRYLGVAILREAGLAILSIHWIELTWPYGCRFLAVQKEVSQ